MLRIVTTILLVLNVRGNIMSLFVLKPLREMIKIMIAKAIKMIKWLILTITKEKLKIKLKRIKKMF